MKLNVLALCAGACGIELGLRLTGQDFRTVCYVEIEAFAAANLVAKIKEGLLDDAPIWSDLKTFNGKPWCGKVDLVTAGFPCQPVSCAGQQKGKEDHRWLWDDIARVVREVGPGWIFLENVPGLFIHGFGDVLGSLATLGFSAEWDVFSAAGVGAPHLRQRVFVLASNTESSGVNSLREMEGRPPPLPQGGSNNVADSQQYTKRTPQNTNRWKESNISYDRNQMGGNTGDCHEDAPHPKGCGLERGGSEPQPISASKAGAEFADNCEEAIANSESQGLSEWKGSTRRQSIGSGQANWWSTEPRLGRVAHGVANRVERLMLCGNGVVPLVAAKAWITLQGRIE